MTPEELRAYLWTSSNKAGMRPPVREDFHLPGGHDQQSHAGDDAPKAGEDARKQALNLLAKSGLKVVNPSRLSPALREAAQIEGPGNVTADVLAAAEGVAEGIDKIRAALVRPEFLDGVKVAVAAYEPAAAAMSVVTGPHGILMLLNTKYKFDGPEGATAERWSVSALQAGEILKSGGARADALRTEYRLSVLHEVAHVIDGRTGNALTGLTLDMLERSGISGDDVPKWLAKNVSGYAATGPKDAAAEIFSMIAGGLPIPRKLAKLKEGVKGVLLR